MGDAYTYPYNVDTQKPEEVVSSFLGRQEEFEAQEGNQGYRTAVFTGLRPTGKVTLGNLLGVMSPTVNAIESIDGPSMLFVADLHGLTTHAPGVVYNQEQNLGFWADLLATGIDPSKTVIYNQSAIRSELLRFMYAMLSLVTTAELERQPALKEKAGNGPINAALLCYPVLMASDILIAGAQNVPVGADQVPHLEMTRLLARRLNSSLNGEYVREPRTAAMAPIKILSLQGPTKMSKSDSNGSATLYLTDEEEQIRNKIGKARTGLAGESIYNPGQENVANLVNIGILASGRNDIRVQQITEIVSEHEKGKSVMGYLKSVVADVVVDYLRPIQIRRRELLANPEYLIHVVLTGGAVARASAQNVLDRIPFV